MHFRTNYASPVGMLTLASDGEALAGLWLQGQKYFSDTVVGEAVEIDDLPVFEAAKRWLDRYFAGDKLASAELPLAPIGSEFRRQVWKILCEIPYGETMTYGEIAKRMTSKRTGAKMSSRAVGGAVGHNPISIIIPCHRVVGSNGSLTGYAGGIFRKVWLLKNEDVDMSLLTVPLDAAAI